MLTRILLGLNLVLLAAVVFLFYKAYAPAAAAAQSPFGQELTSLADTSKAPNLAILGKSTGEGIFFVNTDTLLSKYSVYKTQKEGLEAKSKKLEAELTRRANALQAELGQAQQKIQSGQMTQDQAQEADQRLRQQNAELDQYRDDQTAKLVEEERKQSEKLNKTIQDFLKGFAGRRGYKYVLGYTSVGGILYANDSLDITDAVVAGLNGKLKMEPR
jgi:outer membrane protein